MADQKVISRQTGVEDTQYKWGFEFDIESNVAPRGLNEGTVRFISASSNMIIGSFPPNSRMTGLKRGAQSWAIFRPIAVLPVKQITSV